MSPRPPRRLVAGHAGYPARLEHLERPPSEVHVSGSLPPGPAIAIVGTRRPTAEAAAFARSLAAMIVERGGVVISGGAVGVDAAAHEGALEAGGPTCVVAATGPDELFPAEHAALFARVAASEGAMVWPFARGRKADPTTFLARNGVLVALSDALVIVQAGMPSGTLNAAHWARKIGRPAWAVCAPPWMPGFAGCARAVELGAKPLVHVGAWLASVGLAEAPGPPKQARRARRPDAGGPRTPPPRLATPREPWERAVLEALSPEPKHIDEIAAKSGLSPAEVARALLTLALEDVLVEGPEGLFRLATHRKV